MFLYPSYGGAHMTSPRTHADTAISALSGATLAIYLLIALSLALLALASFYDVVLPLASG